MFSHVSVSVQCSTWLLCTIHVVSMYLLMDDKMSLLLQVVTVI